MQVVLKTVIQVLLTNRIATKSQDEPSAALWMSVLSRFRHAWTASVHVAKALLHPEIEPVLSLGFLASLANQPFQDSPKILHRAEFGDLRRVLLLVAHSGCRGRRTRLELEVGNEHLQGLARTEIRFVLILPQWRASGKLLITSNFDASFLTGTPDTYGHMIAEEVLAETGSLTTFLPLPGFFSNFSPHSNLAKVVLTLFLRYSEKQSVKQLPIYPNTGQAFQKNPMVFLLSSRVMSSMTEALDIWVKTK